MKIAYTRHASNKFGDLKELSIDISKGEVSQILKSPENLDRKTDYPNFIASGRLDKDHIVRIVYKVEGDIMTVITFFPAKKGRYY